ncbi:hypothetical protein ACE1ET_20525, partial [Saccharicrinis sp. FJH62]|uniref:hypothetical protein n=1 Tax=Saccharicrinis sp. FJH62 TaxID=3344657 RepID=UPI0035D5293E
AGCLFCPDSSFPVGKKLPRQHTAGTLGLMLKEDIMKLLTYILFLLPCLTSAQTDNKKLVDSLKFVTDMPYICRDTVITNLSVGCGDKIFWETVKQKQNIIPLLIDKLNDTTQTEVSVPNFGGQYTVADIAYRAILEIIKDIPTFELLGVKFDKNGCGYCSYWNHLREDVNNRIKFQTNVRIWYDKNKSSLVWVKSNRFLTCDCAGRHPNGGHFELRK